MNRVKLTDCVRLAAEVAAATTMLFVLAVLLGYTLSN
jgi:hypothetical protein